jgi:hypothetical protein
MLDKGLPTNLLKTVLNILILRQTIYQRSIAKHCTQSPLFLGTIESVVFFFVRLSVTTS